MDKKHIRSLLKGKLDVLDEETYRLWSENIHNRLFSFPKWKDAKTISVTISRGREVDTSKVIENAWKAGKRIVTPKCDPDTNTMEFRQIKSFDQLERVFFGLLEPIVEETEQVSSDQIDLMIVPGVGYDRNGYRIGYGGGYYDRYLTHYKNDTLALAFSFQMVEKIPREAHDIPVSTIITEYEVIRINA